MLFICGNEENAAIRDNMNRLSEISQKEKHILYAIPYMQSVKKPNSLK